MGGADSTYTLVLQVALVMYMLLSERGYIAMPRPQVTRWDTMWRVCRRGMSASSDTAWRLGGEEGMGQVGRGSGRDGVRGRSGRRREGGREGGYTELRLHFGDK